jgi:hypothetical protein
MRGDKVLVKAYGDRPLERAVWEVGNGKVYISRPELIELCERREAWPIGFPKEDVFLFDDSLYRRLESAARRKDKRQLAGIWSEAKPYLE